jgi:sarcosine oxidase subunit alpha
MIANVTGGKRVTGVELADHRGVSCDAVAMSGGWSPIVNLMCYRGAKPAWDERIAGFVPPNVGDAFVAAGSAAGKMLLSECLADGARAGTLKGKALAIPKCRDEAFAVTPLWWVKQSTGKAFVDYQNDSTAKDLPLAARRATAILNSPSATPRREWRRTRASWAM